MPTPIAYILLVAYHRLNFRIWNSLAYYSHKSTLGLHDIVAYDVGCYML